MTHSSTSSRLRGPARPPRTSGGVISAASGAGADSSPGILTAKTLQCILSGPDSGNGKRRQNARREEYGEEGGDDARISPYDPRFSAAHKQEFHVSITPRQLVQFQSRFQQPTTDCLKHKHKRCSKKPQPVKVVKSSSLPAIRNESEATPVSHVKGSPAAPRSLAPGNQSGSTRDLHHEVQGPEQHNIQKQSQLQHSRILPQHQRQLAGLRSSEPSRASDGKLQGEIQWIHEHLPVLKLASSKCSLKLRQRLFATTIVAHFTRAQLRSWWCQWKAVVAEEKQRELLQLSASTLLIQLFRDLSMDLVRAKFQFWKAWMLESRSQEELAACVCIQQFIRARRKHREREASRRVALDMKQALEIMHADARKVQRAFQTHVHVQRLQTCLRAARQIQHAVRRHQLEMHHKAAVKIQRVYRRHINTERTNLSAMIAHAFESHKARVIQQYWRCYAEWKHASLPLVVVRSLVDRVEYLAAVASIQRHITGFLCRRHVRKCHLAARKVQGCWRSWCHRQCGRRARKMEQLSQSTAACCLQRTFKRNRERLRFRKMLQSSARPMYLRARGYDRGCAAGDESAIARAKSFHERFYVEIVKSAVSVIQSSWRKHIKYAAWKAICTIAATTLQRFLKRTLRISRWHDSVRNAMEMHRQQMENGATRRIQQCWRHHEARKEASANATSLRMLEELAALMRAAMCIQRYFRRSQKTDCWRFVVLQVLSAELPRRRAAVKRIVKLWRAFHDRKQELLKKFGGLPLDNQSSRGMDLAALQELLIAQQLQCERENIAALRIQKMCRQYVDRRNGKVLLQKYKILMRHEMRKRRQRSIIHGFLDEREKERAKKQQQKKATSNITTTTQQSSQQAATGNPALVPSRGDANNSDVSASNSNDTQGAVESNGVAMTDTGNDQDGAELQQFWSDEYQRAYRYNPHTGESTWL